MNDNDLKLLQRLLKQAIASNGIFTETELEQFYQAEAAVDSALHYPS